MQRSLLARLALPFLLAALAACHPVDYFPKTVNARTTPNGELQVDLNLQPKQAYKITATIANAPGPFAEVIGMGAYQAANPNTCGKNNKIAGVAPGISTGVPFALTKVSDNQYEGTMYTDRLQDADYYGRGVCRWEFVAASVSLRATGVEGETVFDPDLSAEEVVAQKSKKIYLLKEFYPRVADYDNFADSGQADRSSYAPAITDDELFTITLTAEKVEP